MKVPAVTVAALMLTFSVAAEEEVKELSGISIIGNKEAGRC